MKTLFILILALAFLGCNPTEKPQKIKKKDAVKIVMGDRIVTKADTKTMKNKENFNDLLIEIYPGNDTIQFSRKRLNLAYKLIPQCRNGDMLKSPDISYETRPSPFDFTDEEEKDFMMFGCEVCQDDYFLMYSYFLKQHNLGKQAEIHRKKLISIYRLINSIHGLLVQGGTFFGHQHNRIYAYAEYSVNLRKDYDKYDAIRDDHPVGPKKSFFIGFLKQLVIEDEKFNMEVSLSDKSERKLALMKKIKELNALITNHFYLNQAQEFNFSQYVN